MLDVVSFPPISSIVSYVSNVKLTCQCFVLSFFRFQTADAAEAAPKPRKERKEPFKIDFLTPAQKDPKEIQKELFAPVTRGAGITLPEASTSKTSKKSGRGRKGKGAEKKEKRYDQTLPDDMHFSSRQLVTLFLKPQFSVCCLVPLFSAHTLIHTTTSYVCVGNDHALTRELTERLTRTSGPRPLLIRRQVRTVR